MLSVENPQDTVRDNMIANLDCAFVDDTLVCQIPEIEEGRSSLGSS